MIVWRSPHLFFEVTRNLENTKAKQRHFRNSLFFIRNSLYFRFSNVWGFLGLTWSVISIRSVWFVSPFACDIYILLFQTALVWNHFYLKLIYFIYFISFYFQFLGFHQWWTMKQGCQKYLVTGENQFILHDLGLLLCWGIHLNR